MQPVSLIGKTVLGLMFHDVTDAPESSGFLQPAAMRYKHTVKQFQRYLDVIEHSGVAVLNPAAEEPEEDTSVVLTFDDGGASASAAAEFLEDRGWRGLFFVTTDLIGTKGFLTADQICDLDARGHLVGSHSCSHPAVFRDLSLQQMDHEWTQSRDVLQQLLGHSVCTASVPGGDCSTASIEAASRAGLTRVYTSEQTTKPWWPCAGAVCFGRLMMLNNTSPATLQRWLSYPTVGVLPERALRFTKSSVKALMGPFYLKMMKRRKAMHEQG